MQAIKSTQVLLAEAYKCTDMRKFEGTKHVSRIEINQLEINTNKRLDHLYYLAIWNTR